jgi:hypothetical protein
MRLPNAELAIIEERKITQYLLARDHPTGAPKAAFFESFGFSSSDCRQLRDALLIHASQHKVTTKTLTQFGEAFEVDGPLQTPDSRNPWVLVVWFVRSGENIPRLVTAVPSKGPKS